VAVKSLYFKDVAPTGASTSLSLQDGGTAPAGALTTTGWTVGKIASTNMSSMLARTKRATGTFSTSDQIPTFAAASAWRSENAISGVFANTNWSLAFRIRASVVSAQTGSVKVRIWKSANADGSSATQLTSAVVTGTTTAVLSTSASATSTVTWAPGGTVTLTNEYLWVQCEWNIVVASGSNTGDAVFYVESASVITTPDFVLTRLPADAGSYTLTGAAAGLMYPTKLLAAAGSYTLTGVATGLGPGYQLTGADAAFTIAAAGGGTILAAAAGSYALTGSAAALAYPATLTAGAGSYALTGTAAGLGLGYWLTGSDVTFTTAAGGGTTLTAAAGTYTLTGSSAALALRHTAGAGSYALTGTAAAYRITLGAGAGSYTLTGSPAGFLAPFKLPAGAGAYTLTGFDAALTVISGIVLFCGSGSYTLTGFDAALPQPGGPVEPPSAGGVGSVSRGRMIRKRRKREEEEEPIPVIGSTPVPEVPPGPSLPPQPSLMAHMPSVQPAKIPKRSDPDEEEDEIALLLELIS